MQDRLIGRVLGPYELVERLGRGGMGVVYRATHQTLRQPRAVKVLRTDLTEDKDFVNRFIQEAQTAGDLRHPNVVLLYDVGQQDDILYLVMELLEGQPLDELIKSSGALALDRTVHLLRQFAAALDFAHARGIVHRDVKPSNAMVGPQDHLTLVDFGIARATDGARLTRTGVTIGTVEYMAPEVITGQVAGPAADLYALGIVAYEMVTGRLPFQAPQSPQVLYAHVHLPPPPPRSLSGNLPEAVDRVIVRQLAKNPAERFSTGAQFVEALLQATAEPRHQPAPSSSPGLHTTPTVITPPVPEPAATNRQPQPLRAPVTDRSERRETPRQPPERLPIPPTTSGSGGGVSRRGLLIGSLAALGGIGVYALTQLGPRQESPVSQPPTATRSAGAAPAATTKPTSGSVATVPAAAAQAPAATSPPVAPPKPAAAPAATPTLGARLIGKLEGATILPDAGRPPRIGEAPMLADLVRAGKLPPVEQRMPDEPLVVKPLREIGKYGGTWRRAFTGPPDTENMSRLMGSEKPLHVDFTGFNIVPAVARSWELRDGGRTIRLSLRKGMKWSDGQPFTASDWMFWYEDIYQNKDLVPVATPEMFIGGKPGTMVSIDDTTIEFQFPEPYPMFVDVLSGYTQMGGGQALGGTLWGGFMGPYAPAHYLKQFHPKYVGVEKLNEMAKGAGVDDWVQHLRVKNNYALNVELPVVTPWRTTKPINSPVWVLERNPYYYAIDTDGNQLPYIDKVQLTLAENLEVANLRAIAGEYDEMGRHLDVPKLPVFLENQQKGQYKVVLDPGFDAAAVAIHVNQSYEADPEIRKWLTDVDFRRALSMGIDRDQLNEILFLGLATPSSLMSEDSSPENAGPEWRTRWSTLDVKQANDLLDKIGLSAKDAQGMRLRTDNGQLLRLNVITVTPASLPYAQIMEIVATQWKKIGIQVDVKETERALSLKQVAANEQQLYAWTGGSPDIFLWPRYDLPAEPSEPYSGTHYATWYASGGTAGKKPEDPELLKAYDMLRKGAGLETAERNTLGQELKKIIVDQQWVIGTVGFAPTLRIVKDTMGNVPDRYSWATRARTPGAAWPPTYYFKS